MTNVPFGEMLDRCGLVQANFPVFNVAIGVYSYQQWIEVPLKDLKDDIEAVMQNPVKVKLIQSTAGKHVYALRTWLDNIEVVCPGIGTGGF
jgi:GTP cyclohydrolase III